MSAGADPFASPTTRVDSAFWGSPAQEAFFWALFSFPASGPATPNTTTHTTTTTHLDQRPAGSRRHPSNSPPNNPRAGSAHTAHRHPPVAPQVNRNDGEQL